MNYVKKFKDFLNAHPYVKGLLSAAEGGAIGAVTSVIIDPSSISGTNLKHLGLLAAGGALIAVRNYLKTSPQEIANK